MISLPLTSTSVNGPGAPTTGRSERHWTDVALLSFWIIGYAIILFSFRLVRLLDGSNVGRQKRDRAECGPG